MAKNVRIKVKHKGSLKKYGFKMNESESKQLKALKKADKAYGSGEVDKKLAALETFNKGNARERKCIRRLVNQNRRR